MVIRPKSRNRKFLGSRRWGGGNIKNRRGSGSRGGIGRAGKKHKFTRIVKYEKERLSHPGFTPWGRAKLNTLRLGSVERFAKNGEAELFGYKILSGGSISHAIKIKASGFSKKAEEKIKKAGGEAIRL